MALSAYARVTALICLSMFVCVCVSFTTLEAALIYSTKNGHQWTANGILFILKKQQLKSASIQKQPYKLTALYHTSYGHTHLLKFKVHFKGTVGIVHKLRHRNTGAKTVIGMSAGDIAIWSSHQLLNQGYMH